ncbi:hypothetical protein AAVH_28298, partial [Aphelenchoides avenae]
MWSGWTLKLAIAAAFCLPVLPASVRLFGANAVLLGEHGYNVINTDATVGKVLYVVSACMTISVTFACGYMEIRSFLVYRTLSVAKRKDFREDVRLLAYAILQLLIQIMLTAFYLCMLTLADAPVRSYALKTFLYIFDALCLSGSVCLMFT